MNLLSYLSFAIVDFFPQNKIKYCTQMTNRLSNRAFINYSIWSFTCFIISKLYKKFSTHAKSFSY